MGRALTYHALRRFVAGEDAIAEVTKAKLYTSAPASRSPTRSCRSTAATATCASWRVERALRDARLGPIGGGTDEVMKEILGGQLGL